MFGVRYLFIYLAMIDSPDEKKKFEVIYQSYRQLMYHIAYQRLHHEQDAEDIVHQVFVKIAEKIEKIEPASPKTRQLVVIMVENKITDLLRVRGKHPETELDENMLNYLSSQPEGEDLLTECIFKLPEKQRQVIWLKYYHGYNLREIAKMMDISLAWAQKLDQRAKQRLRTLYNEAGGKL